MDLDFNVNLPQEKLDEINAIYESNTVHNQRKVFRLLEEEGLALGEIIVFLKDNFVQDTIGLDSYNDLIAKRIWDIGPLKLEYTVSIEEKGEEDNLSVNLKVKIETEAEKNEKIYEMKNVIHASISETNLPDLDAQMNMHFLTLCLGLDIEKKDYTYDYLSDFFWKFIHDRAN